MPDELHRASSYKFMRIVRSPDWKKVRGRGTNGKGYHVDPVVLGLGLRWLDKEATNCLFDAGCFFLLARNKIE